MAFHLREPARELRSIVNFYIYFHDVPTDHRLDLFLPNGQVDLVIDLGEISKPIFDNHTHNILRTVKQAWVSGTRTRAITIPAGSGAEHFIVQFHSGRSLRLLGFPLVEISDRVVQTEDILPWINRELRTRLQEAPDANAKFAVADLVLSRFLSPSAIVHPLIAGVLPLLSQDKRLWNLATLERLTGYSSRYVADQFKRHLGLAPKTWMRLLRFQLALKALGQGNPAADAASGCGYYDQSHLSNEFHEFAGLTPGQYLIQKADDPHYLPVG